MAYRFTGSYPEAEELTQEIIVRLYHQLHHFDPQAHFAVWLNSVARNHCIDRYRARARERRRFISRPAHLPARASRRLEPDRAVERREMRDEVVAALELLSPKLREVVRLRFLRELRYDEIRDRLDIPVGTVKSRIHRGRAELRRHLKTIRRSAGRRRRRTRSSRSLAPGSPARPPRSGKMRTLP